MSVVWGIIFLCAGIYGVYWTGKRSFERRNVAGIEEFASYGKALGTRAIEKMVRIVSWFSVALGGAAILAFFMR